MSLCIGEENTQLTTVWLLATLSGGTGEAAPRGRIRSGGHSYGNGGRTVKKKSLEKLDIVKTCNCIIDISDRVSLRRTSNLMFGTVLAYKGKCLQNWKDVSSCRMLIQRLNRVMGTSRKGIQMNTSGDGEHTNSKGKIQLLRDDPSFDISQGLIAEFVGFGRKEGDEKGEEKDWRDAYEFEVEKEDDEEEREREREVKRLEPETAEEVVGTQTEKWEDLEFGFDANGELVNHQGNAETTAGETEMGEEEIQRSLMEGMVDGFEIMPEFEQHTEEKETEAAGVVNEATEVVGQRKRKARANEERYTMNKRLVVDAEVSLSVAKIKMIRDGYVANEKALREKFMDGIHYRVQNMIVEELVGVAKLYQAEFSQFRKPIGGGGENQMSVFDHDEMDIEVGRMRAHSRSSSVSSIEEARRAERNSSSFHFDFNEMAPGGAGAGEGGNGSERYEQEMDMAQLDISFTGGRERKQAEDILGEENGSEGSETNLASVEDFCDEVAAMGGLERDVSFQELTPHGICGKREASARFMYVLQLATWGRIAVSQSGGLRGEILLKLRERVAT